MNADNIPERDCAINSAIVIAKTFHHLRQPVRTRSSSAKCAASGSAIARTTANSIGCTAVPRRAGCRRMRCHLGRSTPPGSCATAVATAVEDRRYEVDLQSRTGGCPAPRSRPAASTNRSSSVRRRANVSIPSATRKQMPIIASTSRIPRSAARAWSPASGDRGSQPANDTRIVANIANIAMRIGCRSVCTPEPGNIHADRPPRERRPPEQDRRRSETAERREHVDRGDREQTDDEPGQERDGIDATRSGSARPDRSLPAEPSLGMSGDSLFGRHRVRDGAADSTPGTERATGAFAARGASVTNPRRRTRRASGQTEEHRGQRDARLDLAPVLRGSGGGDVDRRERQQLIGGRGGSGSLPGSCHCGYLGIRPSSTCGPSPCGRLSRPRTTTAAPSP